MSDYQQNPYGAPQQPPQQPGYGYPVQGQGHPAQGTDQGYPAQGAYPPASPYQPYPGGYAAPMRPDNGTGTAGLVCGIIGTVCSLLVFLWFFGLVLGILGIIFGAVGRSKVTKGEATNGSAATTGIVLGIASLVILVLWAALFATLVSANSWT
ncbi:hypothetical protein AF335_29440 [Streptomyces eurocidicus]|uniref:DUF4190 domain-containing protein n=1 Tax=Streptomyces eurocidicus TaxID=66423 RepID=A0A2N8NNP6_STREU|nr:DUF4190 domain-containing protein [Streptomyces eurocidicus]MBB5116666.1 hypothetical protein [Streptomyces eurocidicus]MBF6052332.1 DUF4190 domain-containing protein [Streptomyces eurocidicus]PNE30392.1 hypothetical protein AF335_29440 [Streptomyces eurocidicus]